MITFDEAQILGWLSALLMPLFRLLGLFSSAPLLSSRNIPVRYRVMAALSLAVTKGNRRHTGMAGGRASANQKASEIE